MYTTLTCHFRINQEETKTLLSLNPAPLALDHAPLGLDHAPLGLDRAPLGLHHSPFRLGHECIPQVGPCTRLPTDTCGSSSHSHLMLNCEMPKHYTSSVYEYAKMVQHCSYCTAMTPCYIILSVYCYYTLLLVLTVPSCCTLFNAPHTGQILVVHIRWAWYAMVAPNWSVVHQSYIPVCPQTR